MNYQISNSNQVDFLEISVENMKEWKEHLITMFLLTLNLEKGKCILNGERIKENNILYSKGFVDRDYLDNLISNNFIKNQKVSLDFLDKDNKFFAFEIKKGDYFITSKINGKKTLEFLKREDFFKKYIIEDNKCYVRKEMIECQ
jgi:hypothetical protein